MTKEEAEKLAAEIESLYPVKTKLPHFEDLTLYPSNKDGRYANSYYVAIWLDQDTLVGCITDIKQIEIWCQFAEIVGQAKTLQHMEDDHIDLWYPEALV